MILKFRVYEQTISLQSTKAEPRQGSRDYLELQFSFSSDWNDLLKYVYIQHGEVSVPHDLVEGSIIVDEYFTEQTEFNVTLFGKSADGSIEVPTNVVTVFLKESNNLWEKDAPEPQNSWVVQVVDARDEALAAANDAIESAKQAEASADRAAQIADEMKKLADQVEQTTEVATQAKTDAQTAQSKAETAQGAAEAAWKAAEDAANSTGANVEAATAAAARAEVAAGQAATALAELQTLYQQMQEYMAQAIQAILAEGNTQVERVATEGTAQVNAATEQADRAEVAAGSAGDSAAAAGQARQGAETAAADAKNVVAAHNAAPDAHKELFAKCVKTVNGAAPDESGNVDVTFVVQPPETWAQFQQMLRAGVINRVLSVGDQAEISISGSAVDFDIQGIDEDVPSDPALTHSVSLLMHNCLYNMAFDPAQYLYVVDAAAWPDGLPAGTYNITLDHGAYNYSTTQDGTYQFTITQTVPVGGGIRHTQMGVWRSDNAYNKDNLLAGTFTTYAADRITTIESGLATTEGAEGTNLGTTTARDPQYKVGDYINFTQRQGHGSGRWSTSWLRQVLNSADAIVQFVPATKWSRPASSTQEGFLHSLDPELVKVLGKTRRRYALSIADGYGYEDVEDIATLNTMTDMGLGSNNAIPEGPVDAEGNVVRIGAYSYWDGTTNADKIKLLNGAVRYWWLGSTYPSYSYNERVVSTAGALSSSYASSTNGVVPRLIII